MIDADETKEDLAAVLASLPNKTVELTPQALGKAEAVIEYRLRRLAAVREQSPTWSREQAIEALNKHKAW